MSNLFKYDHYSRLARSASLSECKRYRWWLRRHYTGGGDGLTVCFIMLNPSTADALQDDPTIRRCLGFVRAWGHSTLSVRNLYPWRATDPKELRALSVGEATGGTQGLAELMAGLTADKIIVAWGAHDPFGASESFLALARLRKVPLWCLGKTKSGAPRHPLYVRGDQVPVPFQNI